MSSRFVTPRFFTSGIMCVPRQSYAVRNVPQIDRSRTKKLLRSIYAQGCGDALSKRFRICKNRGLPVVRECPDSRSVEVFVYLAFGATSFLSQYRPVSLSDFAADVALLHESGNTAKNKLNFLRNKICEPTIRVVLKEEH